MVTTHEKRLRHRLALLGLAAVLALTVTACGTPGRAPSATPTPGVTQEPSVEGAGTAPPTAEPTTAPSPEPSATTLIEPSPTPTVTALTGPRATALALVDSVTFAPAAGTPTREPIAADDYPALFERAWEIVYQNYLRDDFNGVDWEAIGEAYRPRVEAVQGQEAFWDLMEAFVGELGDNHSRFVRPDQFGAEFDLDLPGDREFRPWPGLIIWPPAREDDQFAIWAVCQVGPAAAAGLQRGDVILAVGGEPVQVESDYDRVREALYGDHEAITLTVQRGPDRAPEEVTIEYGAAAGCGGWEYGFLSYAPRIGYVRVPDFAGDADVNILQAIEEMEAEGPLEGLILDVRHNPGGNADRSIAIFTTGVFGQVGPLREDETRTVYRIRGPVRWNETTPLAVLTDGNSHSAAEYFATAMQQSGRALLVGMPTAGNTEGISGFSLPDGSLIRLAVSTLQLPDGSTLEGTGVIPDIPVPLGPWGLRQEPDIQLSAALEALIGGPP
jgi:carboxyl-terminal processing protease